MSRIETSRSNTAGPKVTTIVWQRWRLIWSAARSPLLPRTARRRADPVQVGFIASLNRPEGNLTGVTSLDTELGRKRLQLLHELLPNAGTIAALLNPTFPGSDFQTKD